MIRAFNLLLALACIGALIGVYGLKYAVEGTAATKLALEATIRGQEGELSLLKADWAYLNQPAHVAPIVTRHAAELGLQAVTQAQFGQIDAIPMRPARPDAGALSELLQSLAAGVDPAGETTPLGL